MFFRLDSTDSRRVGRRNVSLIVPIVFPICPPLYLMLILWVLGVKIRYVICLFIIMSAVTGRTLIDWRYRTLKAGVIRQCGVRLGLLRRSLSLFAIQTQMCLL